MSSPTQPVPPAPLSDARAFSDTELKACVQYATRLRACCDGEIARGADKSFGPCVLCESADAIARLLATIADRDKRLAAVIEICTDIMQDVVPSWMDDEMDDWQYTGVGIACEVFSAAEGRTP
jgi:hypothetical protein